MANNKKMTKFNEISILLIPIVWFFCNAAIAPALGSIAQHFTTASDLQLKMVLSITSVTSVLFSIIAGKLTSFIDKKTLVIVGLVIYGFGGIFTTFCTTIDQVLIMRLITGIGVGLVLPMPGAIISENFEGEKRSRLIGLCTSTANISNVVVSVIVGFILAYGWQYPFYTFALSFIMVITTIVGVPRTHASKTAGTEINADVHMEKLDGGIYILAVFMFLAWMVHVTLTTNLALFWVREKIGAQSMIGLILSISALASIVVGAIYPELKKIFKEFSAPAALLAFGIGFLILYLSRSVPLVFLGCILEGTGFGLIMPTTTSRPSSAKSRG
jgi:predicted MFS family arabinose efflux permease